MQVIRTAKSTGETMSVIQPVLFDPAAYEVEEEKLVNIYPELEYQTIVGFGGAITEAVTTTVDKLSEDLRDEILEAYYGKDGIGYTIGRTHINSCDFSLGNYAYDETDGDVELKDFSLGREDVSLVPFIKQANAKVGMDLKLLASPWSPPAWMKDTQMMNFGGTLLPEYRQVWADYYVRYLQEMEKRGINIEFISVQNEPKAMQIWDSCIYTAEEERDFVKNFLGPTLEKNGYSHIKIVVWDHNKERAYERAKVAFSDQLASKYIWGLGFHWYSGDHFETLDMVHENYPDKALFFTEGCHGIELKADDAWSAAEHYAYDILGNLNHHMTTWCDWNIVLDETGGPNHVSNFCDAPIIADTKANKVIYRSAYYFIGHISKYVKPGAVRIGYSKYTGRLDIGAFKNLDGSIVLVMLNRTDEEITANLRCEGYGVAQYRALPHSITTFII